MRRDSHRRHLPTPSIEFDTSLRNGYVGFLGSIVSSLVVVVLMSFFSSE